WPLVRLGRQPGGPSSSRSACKTTAQAIAVASSPLVFNNGEMAIPAIVYALVMNVVLLAYLKMLR
ncbi:hypothetical protein LEA_08942, partial [human gut metagenome]